MLLRRHHRGLWDHVKGRLVASMLMLANTWPLAQVLDDHPLVGFINAQHRRLREQLLQAKMQQQRMQEEAHRASDRDAASPAKDSQGEEEEEVLVQEVVCARCEKFLRKVSEVIAAKVWARCLSSTGSVVMLACASKWRRVRLLSAQVTSLSCMAKQVP